MITLQFICSCQVNKNSIPAVVENSNMIFNTSFQIPVSICTNPTTFPPPDGYVPNIQSQTFTVYNFIDPAFAPAKNLNVVLLRSNFIETPLQHLIMGFVYINADDNNDSYFDDMQTDWVTKGLITIQDPSILTDLEKSIQLA
jgi:hypothetical protein